MQIASDGLQGTRLSFGREAYGVVLVLLKSSIHNVSTPGLQIAHFPFVLKLSCGHSPPQPFVWKEIIRIFMGPTVA